MSRGEKLAGASSKRWGFTLIEVLVVVAIIALLLAILLPSFKRVNETARLSICMSNVHQIALAITAYGVENEGCFPVPPLDPKYSYKGHIVGWTWMQHVYGGDDESDYWPPVDVLPARLRPMAKYIDPYAEVWRCPGDSGPIDSMFPVPMWDGLTTSYQYNAIPNSPVEYLVHGPPDKLHVAKFSQLKRASVTIVLGDQAYKGTKPDIPENDLKRLKTQPSAWWHPRGFKERKVNIGFADGHAHFTRIEFKVPNTGRYRRTP